MARPLPRLSCPLIPSSHLFDCGNGEIHAAAQSCRSPGLRLPAVAIVASAGGGCGYGIGPIHRAASHCPAADPVRAYLEQILAGLRDAGQAVFHIVLDADEDVLRQRIEGSGEAQAWRLAHLAQCRASRSWMIGAADLVVNTGDQTPSAVVHQIAGALPGL